METSIPLYGRDGLILFSMRGLVQEGGWNDRLLKVTFWGTNMGLVIMFAGTLLPVGILQVLDNIKYGAPKIITI